MPLLTQVAYARHRKVTPPYINKLVRQGRIAVNRGGLINRDRADASLAASRRLGRVPPGKLKANGHAAPGAKAARLSSDTRTLTGWRSQTEEFKAKSTKLEYERMLGDLLPREQVLEAERRKNSTIRTRLRRMARVLAPSVKAAAATATTAEIELLILEKIDDALHELAADPLGTVAVAWVTEELQSFAEVPPAIAPAEIQTGANA